MNYLILGNGFDLAHSYKTRYQDFLDWIKQEINLYNSLDSSKRLGVNMRVNSDASLLTTKNKVSRTHTGIQKEIWERHCR